jgi:hypothetical protein
MAEETLVNIDYTFSVDNTHSLCNYALVRYGDIAKRLKQAHGDSAKRLSEIHNLQNELRSAYRRYLDLEADAKRYEKRMTRIVAALREQEEFENLDESVKSGKSISKAVGIPMDPDSVPLWEIMLAILEETGELQVIELELALKSLGFDTSRSAIESSLKTHPNEFKTRGDGRAKFVSLKGA